MLNRREMLRMLGATAAVAAIPRLDGAAASSLDDGELSERIDEYLQAQVSSDAFSGAVLVTHGARHVYTRAFGYADRARGRLNHLDTLFNLGSINKSFTAVGIAQLVEGRAVAYDAPISAYLPEYPRPAGDAITVHQLLTHRSGLVQGYWTERFREIAATLERMRNYLPLFQDLPLLFPPGTRTSYSNTGYVVLGAIIEAVSGQTYYDYVRNHIYRPAGMGRTDSHRPADDVPNLAIGYTLQGPDGTMLSTREPNDEFLGNWRGSSAGGGYSTLRDMWRFARALTRGRLLRPTAVEMITTGKESLEPSGPPSIAYGFLDRRSNGTRIVENNGGAPGINATFQMYRDLGYIVVVLANYDPPAATLTANRIGELMRPNS
jgi:CubicO group peptidase (beta-lactamase class C family)